VDDIAESEPNAPAATVVPLAAASYGGSEEPGAHRRRRRRRRRGRGQLVLTPETQAVPERHIFRSNTDGSLVATGETAPPEPSRAITPVRHEPAAVAIEPPPRSLSVTAERLRVARPARRRRGPEGDTLEVVATIAALPSPPDLTEEPAPKRTRTRKAVEAVAEPVSEAKPKRVRSTTSTAAKSTAVKKASAKKTTTRKVATRKKKT
jgi:hypothetical protein